MNKCNFCKHREIITGKRYRKKLIGYLLVISAIQLTSIHSDSTTIQRMTSTSRV